MSSETFKGTYFDYSDNKVVVYFEVADKINAITSVASIYDVEDIIEHEYGFSMKLAIQQIPEMIQQLTNENIAIYAVVPQK